MTFFYEILPGKFLILCRAFAFLNHNLDGHISCRATAPLRDQAMVWLNGLRIGPLAWSPWEIEITEHLQPGPNELQLHLGNSPRNLLYGDPRPSGLGDAQIQIIHTPDSAPQDLARVETARGNSHL